jgi:dienelactone hydrolase
MSVEKRFAYRQGESFGEREVSTLEKDGVLIRNFTYLSPFSRRLAAFYVRPKEEAEPFPCILYVHWYEPESIDSNRTQFLDEAVQMARRGAASLLVETMWSDRDWFHKRTQAEDLQNSVEQVVELRQAMDLLLSQPNVDPSRFEYVGHDFGAMYGVVMGAVDRRPGGYVLMAGTPRFPDWYLYYPRLEDEAREAFLTEFEEIDPVSLVGELSPAPVLFQFADKDPHVPDDRARIFFEAAGEPKELRWYQAGHGLNKKAAEDRIAWLTQLLNLKHQEK